MLFDRVCIALERSQYHDADPRLTELCNATDMLHYIKQLDNDILSGYIFQKMNVPITVRVVKLLPVGARTIFENGNLLVYVRAKLASTSNSDVGGVRCGDDTLNCIRELLHHEFVHIMIILVRVELCIPNDIWIHWHAEFQGRHFHSILFRTWLWILFGHYRIDNNLLLD
jgi:hypothetical protein